MKTLRIFIIFLLLEDYNIDSLLKHFKFNEKTDNNKKLHYEFGKIFSSFRVYNIYNVYAFG
jgi:hypothetical protein